MGRTRQSEAVLDGDIALLGIGKGSMTASPVIVGSCRSRLGIAWNGRPQILTLAFELIKDKIS
jgi:hypothetical protein